MSARRRLLLSLALSLGLAAPALAQSCDDPDMGLDLSLRIQACEDFLWQVYDRSSFPHLVFNLGSSYRQAGQLDQALPLLTEALRYNPRNEWYWAELGLLYLALEEPGTAAAMYTEARRLAPENPWLALEQAEAWLALGLGGRCLENMDTALAGFSGMVEEAWLLQVMGRCQAQTGRHAEAVTAFTAALAVNPASVDAMGYRAVSQHAMGDYEALIADSAAMFAPGGGVEATPDWELTVRGLRIEAMVFLGRPDEAVAEVAAVRGRFPGGDLGAINLQAWGLFLIGNLDEADRAIRPIRDHEDPAALTGYMKDTLGQIDLALGRLEAAESALLDAAWYDPAIATGWLPALTTQGFLPQTRGADDILLSLLDCIEERGALCSLGPLAVDPTARVPLPARPDPGPSAVPGPSEAPPPADAPGFEPSPGGDVTEPPGVPPPAAAEEGAPGLGAAPRPVRPVAP